jgi:hypothetical protein
MTENCLSRQKHSFSLLGSFTSLNNFFLKFGHGGVHDGVKRCELQVIERPGWANLPKGLVENTGHSLGLQAEYNLVL